MNSILSSTGPDIRTNTQSRAFGSTHSRLRWLEGRSSSSSTELSVRTLMASEWTRSAASSTAIWKETILKRDALRLALHSWLSTKLSSLREVPSLQILMELPISLGTMSSTTLSKWMLTSYSASAHTYRLVSGHLRLTSVWLIKARMKFLVSTSDGNSEPWSSLSSKRRGLVTITHTIVSPWAIKGSLLMTQL